MDRMIQRKSTRQIMVGSVPVGGGAPVSVQSMTNTPTQDVAATAGQIRRMEAAGCDIVRVAVPDAESAAAIARIKETVRIPVIADIHFDHRLAVAAPVPVRTVCGSTRATSAARKRSRPWWTAPETAGSRSVSASTRGPLKRTF